MKNKLFYTILIFIAGTNYFYGQEFKVGGGVALGTEASIDDDFTGKSAFGLNVRGVYKFNEKWGVTGGFTYFFSEAPEPIDLTVYQYNFDGIYSFVKNDKVDFYGLLGFDVGYARAENENEVNSEIDDSQVGLDIGIGIMTEFGVYFEAKAEGAFDQGQFTLGYLFKL